MIRREGMALHPLVFQRIPLCKEGVPGWDILEALLRSSAGQTVRPRSVKEANSTLIPNSDPDYTCPRNPGLLYNPVPKHTVRIGKCGGMTGEKPAES